MSSSPVVELEGWRLNQITGLSLLATAPPSAAGASSCGGFFRGLLAGLGGGGRLGGALRSGGAAGGQAQRHGRPQRSMQLLFSWLCSPFGVKRFARARGCARPAFVFMIRKSAGKNKVKFHRNKGKKPAGSSVFHKDGPAGFVHYAQDSRCSNANSAFWLSMVNRFSKSTMLVAVSTVGARLPPWPLSSR